MSIWYRTNRQRNYTALATLCKGFGTKNWEDFSAFASRTYKIQRSQASHVASIESTKSFLDFKESSYFLRFRPLSEVREVVRLALQSPRPGERHSVWTRG